jgi:hypothetical protein
MASVTNRTKNKVEYLKKAAIKNPGAGAEILTGFLKTANKMLHLHNT